METYLLTTINVVGIVQALFIAIALLYLPGRHAGANRMLALLMLTFAAMFAYDVLYYNDLIFRFPLLVLLRLPLILLYGPLFLLYLLRITAAPGQAGPVLRQWLHVIPFVVAALLYLQSVWLSREELLQVLNYADLRRQFGDDFQPNLIQQVLWQVTVYLRMPVFTIHLGICLILGYRLLAGHAKRVEEHFSFTDRVSLGWVRHLLVFVVVLWTLVIAKEFLFPASVLGVWLNDLTVVGQVVFVFMIGLFGLLQTTIFTEKAPPAELDATRSDAPAQRYALSEPESGLLLSRLQDVMAARKPWQDSDLTLATLADMLNVAPRHLSQVINGRLGRNFLDFINGYRIGEALRHLDDPANASSILTIAMDAGFNSKSAFYNAFRRHVGLTPSQYRHRRGVVLAPEN